MGRRKPSWEALRREASPVKTLAVTDAGEGQFEIRLVTRSLENDLPAYTLYDYGLIWTAYNEHEQPVAAGKVRLPQLAPGSEHVEAVEVVDNVVRVHAEVFRPTGYSVLDVAWEK
jgi:beta-glucuronidase